MRCEALAVNNMSNPVGPATNRDGGPGLCPSGPPTLGSCSGFQLLFSCPYHLSPALNGTPFPCHPSISPSMDVTLLLWAPRGSFCTYRTSPTTLPILIGKPNPQRSGELPAAPGWLWDQNSGHPVPVQELMGRNPCSSCKDSCLRM